MDSIASCDWIDHSSNFTSVFYLTRLSASSVEKKSLLFVWIGLLILLFTSLLMTCLLNLLLTWPLFLLLSPKLTLLLIPDLRSIWEKAALVIMSAFEIKSLISSLNSALSFKSFLSLPQHAMVRVIQNIRRSHPMSKSNGNLGWSSIISPPTKVYKNWKMKHRQNLTPKMSPLTSLSAYLNRIESPIMTSAPWAVVRYTMATYAMPSFGH